MSYHMEDVLETSKELFAGTVGACAGIVAGQPLDFVKVRLQSQPNLYTNVSQTVGTTLRNEGALAFFRGMSSPLLGNAPINAIVFGCNSVVNRWFDRKPKLESYTYTKLFTSGCVAGAVQTIVCSPIELIKCRMQVASIRDYSALSLTSISQNSFLQHKLAPSSLSVSASFHPSPATVSNEFASQGYSNSWQCVSHMYRTHGPSIFLRGYWATLWRDCPSYGVWFATFEFTKLKLAQYSPSSSTRKSTATSSTHLLIAGAVAGCLTWSVVYPVDVFKSMIQTMPLSTPRDRRTLRSVASQCWQEGGWNRCWRGWQSTMMRAAPVSAITFFVYETCLKNLHGVGMKYIDWE